MSDSPARIQGPDEVIAAVPSALGFYPSRSLILIALHDDNVRHDRTITFVARHDLEMPPEARAEVAEGAASLAQREHLSAVTVLIVDSGVADPGPQTWRCAHRGLLDAVQSAFTARGIALEGMWGTTAITAGSRWWSLTGADRTGLVADPEPSPLAPQHTDHPIHPSRESLAAQIRVDPVLAGQVREILSTAPRSNPAPTADSDATQTRHAVVTSLLARIDTLAPGTELAPADYADVAAALRDHVVRDCMVGLATTPRARSARQFWGLLTRGLPDPERAETAALLAYCAYIDGEGTLAMLAAQAATRSDPDHGLAELLTIALHTGMSPELLHEPADNALALAADMGINLYD